MASCTDGRSSSYYVGDEGTVISVDTCNSIEAATVVELKVRKPDGTDVDWTGTRYGTHTIRYTSQSGDFDQAGEYRLQAYIVSPDWTGRGDVTTFKIKAAFE